MAEFGATLGCKGCPEIRPTRSEECRARITAKMERDSAKRLQENTTKRPEFSWQAPDENCCLEVCDELTETIAFVDIPDEGFTDEMTGAPLLRDEVVK